MVQTDIITQAVREMINHKDSEQYEIKVFQDCTWILAVEKSKELRGQRIYKAAFKYKTGVEGMKIIQFNSAEDVHIQHRGRGKNVKVRNDIKNLIVNIELQYRIAEAQMSRKGWQ